MVDILSIGTATIDIYYKGESLTEKNGRFELALGGKYFADYFYEGLGGGGANVACGLSDLGIKTGLMATIGKNPFTNIILQKLADRKIVFENFCDIVEGYMNVSSILLSKIGEKTVVNYRANDEKIFENQEDFAKLIEAKNIYMANLSKVPLDIRIEALKFAKKHNIRVFGNLNVTDCRKSIDEIIHYVRYVDVMFLNGYEFADLIKVPYQSIDFEGKIVDKYALFNHDDLLVITDGKKGSYAYFGNKVYHQKAISIDKVIDTTGAGDGFTAGFIASYVKGQTIKEALKSGAEYASKIIQKLGAN
jgi:sugar/nucleoside kinase (ribokinase family)